MIFYVKLIYNVSWGYDPWFDQWCDLCGACLPSCHGIIQTHQLTPDDYNFSRGWRCLWGQCVKKQKLTDGKVLIIGWRRNTLIKYMCLLYFPSSTNTFCFFTIPDFSMRLLMCTWVLEMNYSICWIIHDKHVSLITSSHEWKKIRQTNTECATKDPNSYTYDWLAGAI